MAIIQELTEYEIDTLNDFLGYIQGAAIPNVEALDGFLAAIACCPDMIMPSEYLPFIQSSESGAEDLVFEDIDEAMMFTELVTQQMNYVNLQLREKEAYLPFVLEDEDGKYQANDWAKGFLRGVELRPDIWHELFEDEERGGSIIPIFGLAYEDHEDPEFRPFDEPVTDEHRENLLVGAAAGVMQMYRHFLTERKYYKPETKTYTRDHRKVGRNEPCPCGSGKKYKKCCGTGATLH